MENGFDALEGIGGFDTGATDNEGQATPEVKTDVVKKSKDSEVFKTAKSDLEEALKDEDYLAVRNTKSSSIRVLNTLAYTGLSTPVLKTQEKLEKAIKAGTVKVLAEDDPTPLEVKVVDGVPHGVTKKGANGKYVEPINLSSSLNAEGKHKPYRVLGQVAKPVGNIIQNISDEPIEYSTEIWTKGEDGRYTSEEVTKTLMPGESTQISKKWLNILGAKREFNNIFENGSISAREIWKEDATLEEILDKQYFQFSAASGYTIHDPEVNKRIDKTVKENGENKSVLLPEFEACFGFLSNEPIVVEKTAGGKKTTGAKKAKGPKPSAQEVAAIALRRKLGME